MTIFDLHAAVLDEYRDFVRSFLLIADRRIQEYVDRVLDEEARLWPDFLLQVSPSYQRGLSVDDLAGRSDLHPETARIFRTPRGEPYRLYRHQEQALEALKSGYRARTGRLFPITFATMLVRRLKERAAAPSLIHIGTSATMLSDRDAAPAQRHQDEALRAELEARGYQVIVIRHDREVSEQLRRWASLFGAV